MRTREDHAHDVQDIRRAEGDPSRRLLPFKRKEFPAPHTIVHVTHDEEDGAWQFHSVNGPPDDPNEHRLVALEEIVKREPTIAQLADLPVGWRAFRNGSGPAWARAPYTRSVYVRIPHRGRNAWVVALGRMRGPMRFEILPTPGHDPVAERWQFLPGTVVVCELWRRSFLDGMGRSLRDPPIDEQMRAARDAGGPVLVALREWEPESPLPAPGLRLRLVTPREILVVRAAVEERDPECLVCLAELDPCNSPQAPEQALRDLSVLALGQALAEWARIGPPSRVWRRVDRAVAERHLRYVLAHDLAYGDVVLDEATAGRIAQSFLALFSQDAGCFTNHDLDEDGSPVSGTPILKSTMEGGIGVVDGQRAGLLFVTGED